MPVHDDLGKRMKEFYEKPAQTKLIRRMPVAIRIDGKAFHTFTRGFQKPFDNVLIKTMQETTKYLCENIQNCIFGFTQSDEITLILVDYKTDYIPKGKEINLEEKYRVQLDLYKKALENSLKRKVDKAMIYALS